MTGETKLEPSPLHTRIVAPGRAGGDGYVRELEADVRRREAVLEAVCQAACHFLTSEHWDHDLQTVLGRLGRAAEVSRVYLFETSRDDRGIVRAAMRHEWVTADATPRLGRPEVQSIPLAEVGLARWERLALGEEVHGSLATLRPEERAYFAPIGIQSIAVMPVFAGTEWWGFLGLTDDTAEREWPPHLLDALRAAAATFGAAIHRQRAERELRESEERFRRLVDAAVEGIVIHDQGIVLEVSPAFERMYGYTRDELLGRSILELVTSPESREVIERHVRSGSTERYEVSGPRRDGSLLVAEITARPAVYRGRAVRVATVHDITERKRAEQALQQRETQLAEAEALAHLGSWEMDPVTGSIRWSDELYRIFGLEPGTVSRESFLERIHPDDRASVVAALRRLEEAESTFALEHRIIRPDGAVRVLRSQGKLVPGAAARPARFIGTHLDITERREAEESARRLIEERAARAAAERAESRASFLAEASRVLGTSFDYETTLASLARLAVPTLADYCAVDLANGTGEVERVGVAHREPSKEVLVREAARYACTGVQGLWVQRVLASGTPVLVPLVDEAVLESEPDDGCRLILGRLRPCSLISVPLRVGERTLGALTLCTAVESGRRYGPDDLALTEELARRASLAVDNARLFHQAQEATQARDEILGVVVHDLRNPLGTIRMAAALLADGVPADRVVERKQLEIIRRAVERMQRLIRDLLDVRRIESGRLAVEPRPVAVAALVHEALEMLRPLAAAKSLALEADEMDEGTIVLADAVRVQQVLSNLVGNAIKFTPAGGRVALRVASAPTEVRLSVEDSGPGIPPEHLPHVFARFWQGRRADRRGVGLGLGIAKGLVEAHGGRIWIESQPGQGCSVFFTLPRADRPPG